VRRKGRREQRGAGEVLARQEAGVLRGAVLHEAEVEAEAGEREGETGARRGAVPPEAPAEAAEVRREAADPEVAAGARVGSEARGRFIIAKKEEYLKLSIPSLGWLLNFYVSVTNKR